MVNKISQNAIEADHVINLMRLGMEGKRKDLFMYAQKLLRRYKQYNPQLALVVSGLLKNHHDELGGSILRGNA